MSGERAPSGHRRREVAVVLAITPTGSVTARTPGAEAPTEGEVVTAARGTVSATVTRVFGPVVRPYLSLHPRRPLRAPEAAALIGAPLYRAA